MNEYMIEIWNKYIQPGDKVYLLGDFIISESSGAIDKIMSRLNGTKVLIRGNHDNAKLSIYAKYFKDIRATSSLRDKHNRCYIMSHYPLHPGSLGNCFNLHGHTHQRSLEDSRYINMCVEATSYMPIDFDSFNAMGVLNV